MRVADYVTLRQMVLLPRHCGSSVAMTTPLVVRPPLLLRCPPLTPPPRDDIATAVITASSSSPTCSHSLEQRQEAGGALFRSGSNGTKATHNDKNQSRGVSLFGVFLVSRPNFAERSILHFERAKICRTGKCSTEWEAFRNGLSELDNVAPFLRIVTSRDSLVVVYIFT